MKEINVYLTFDGNCREAMQFYEKCLGGELQLLPFSAFEGKCDYPAEAKDRIMHSRLSKGAAVLMASDSMPGMPFQAGNNFSVCIQCESLSETQKLFNALSDRAQVLVPLQDMFWGAHFGMVTDRFGINWMFNFEQPKGTTSERLTDEMARA